MEIRKARRRGPVSLLLGLLCVPFAYSAAEAQTPQPAALSNFGPYNATFLAGGIGLNVALSADAPVLAAGAPWSVSGWLRSARASGASLTVVALGDPHSRDCRRLLLDQSRLQLQVGSDVVLHAPVPFEPGVWHAVAATYDGRQGHLYVDGKEVDSRTATTSVAAASLHIAPEDGADLTGAHHFGGDVADLRLHDRALDAQEVRALSSAKPNFNLIDFHQVGVGWPLQRTAWRGLQEPQPAWTLPHSRAPLPQASPPAASAPHANEPMLPVDDHSWLLRDWRLAAAPRVSATEETLSSSKYQERDWYPATVPGTVLTTLIADGVYPDPDYGLNNMEIPESLNKQDYWYRTRFTPPASVAGRRLTLTFRGINYTAQVWLNGVHLGTVHGAFVRGVFDVTSQVRPGEENVLAVRVSPPPHPGIPHEQSVAAGPGENGGHLALDGPTFVATEGWDWIPAVRDRDTGIWQDVELSASGAIRILDPQVITRLPLPRTDTADITIRVPVANEDTRPLDSVIDATIGEVHVHKAALLQPGVNEVVLQPGEFPELRLPHPRLWWPNGYGAPDLYTAKLEAHAEGRQSDSKLVRFGIREITYELSLFDSAGTLRRVEVDPTAALGGKESLVDVSHGAIKRTANGWAESLTPTGETSSAVHDVPNTSLSPYLVIHVNGVPIAARGGSWGMDDSRKRVSRERLEPFFRLHQRAHLNIIRNWLGQDTEGVFYDLADEYGLLILNDFWVSTQDFQLEPQDPQLFLRNARDVISRYRNHPSIAVWFGRNEGVPQPIVNEGLAGLVAELDGTRYYTGSSNRVNLQDSGPYNWRPPESYFTDLAKGFAVEVGTPSLASLDSLRATIPEPDQWPLGDVFAYHDWHFGGNGDTATFMSALETRYGAASSLADFERKAQLMNYVTYRAIFEGFQAHLWTGNSGRLLWMTHPAWPSNAWQIYTSDYDAAAAYYAVAKACEPLHVQMDLPDFRPVVVNTTRLAQTGLKLRTRIVSLDNRPLLDRETRVDAKPNDITVLEPLALKELLLEERVVLVQLTLSNSRGALSSNLYWQAADPADERRLVGLPDPKLAIRATRNGSGEGSRIEIRIDNPGATPALLTRLTLLDANGKRVLPAYYSENYVSVLPHESRIIEAQCPAQGKECASLTVRGWNVPEKSVSIREH